MKIEDEANFDALIVGGGPAGSTAAIALAQAGWRVGVVERSPYPRRKVCGEFISATSWPLLRRLGVAAALRAQTGPEIRRIGLYAGESILAADMPSPRGDSECWGRALGREQLDTVLLARAEDAGARVMQPWTLARVERSAGGYRCSGRVKARRGNAEEPRAFSLHAKIVVAAHGSWETGAMPTQRAGYPARASDLFAFKAHFRGGKRLEGLMPLLLFPGGYGGIVQTDHGRASLSCCIRRDALERCRRTFGRSGERSRAAHAVIAHIQASCRGVREALTGATLDGAWLSAGPIRPGIRPFGHEGIYAVGNAAGEAHPIVAEGISMAIQSAWLLCEHLVAHGGAARAAGSPRTLAAIGRAYERSWRRNFAGRIRAAALFAQLGMRPASARPVVALLKRAPSLLTFGARWSGKTQSLRSFPTIGRA